MQSSRHIPYKWLSISLARLPHIVVAFSCIFLLLFAFFAKMAFSNLILARGDTFLYFYPYWQAAAAALRQGRVPLWNPNLFMGVPLLANSQVGFFYPLNWPVWLLFTTPYAVKASILLHLFIAGWGAYLAGRRVLALDTAAATVTAVLFTLSGYLTAQVEHVNQLQGLAWLPWFLVVLAVCAQDGESPRQIVISKGTAAFAILFTLQLLAGHTQTTFITGVGVLVWGGTQWLSGYLTGRTGHALHFRFYVRRLWQRGGVAFMLGGVLALLLAAVQLLPTLELVQLSSRQGGLSPNEVLSFSLHPLLLTRALLPGYGQALFSEYTAFLPLTALLLALSGGWQWRRQRGVLPAVMLVVVGLLLALGLFNPLNWLLARIPGFNLFRVPARWLILYTLGVSLLAGLGWQTALDRWQQQTKPWSELSARVRGELWQMERPLQVGLYLLLGLILWAVIANILANFFPTGPEAPYEAPNRLTPLLWLAELLLAYIWLSGVRFRRQQKFGLTMMPGPTRSPWLLLMVGVAVLFAASRTQPYNNLTTPEAYFDLRPPVTRLLAGNQRSAAAAQWPDARFLSLSNTFFDPGDQGEIDTIYADQLDAAARYDYTVAIKQKEIIAPNLPLAYGLVAVDGFDGGILPLRTYSQVMTLLLPDGTETSDGRLREHLTAVPATRWLNLFNVRYLITDKTGDQWREAGSGRDFSIFFDRQHPVTLAAGESLAVAYVPDFVATAVYVIGSGSVGQLSMITTAGAVHLLPPQTVDTDLFRYMLPTSSDMLPSLQALQFEASSSWTVQAVTLVNEADGTFLSLVPEPYRLVHSGDVKIYENLEALPRAFLVDDWQWQPDMDSVLTVMRAESFNPVETAVIMGQPQPAVTGVGADMEDSTPILIEAVSVVAYTPEHIEVLAQMPQAALLVFTDTFYPGWETAVDDKPTALLSVDGMFRGVLLPAGTHHLTFTYRPHSFFVGRWLTLLGIAILGCLSGLSFLARRQN